MMNVTATLYIFLAIAAAYVVHIRHASATLTLRIFIGWFTVTGSIFLIPDNLSIFTVLAAVNAALSPRSPSGRVAYFIALMPAVPEFVQADIPFFGLNYLLSLSWSKVLCLAVFGPFALSLFVAFLQKKGDEKLNLIDVLVIAYYTYISFALAVASPFTSSLRQIVDNLIVFFIPYFVVSRGVRTIADVKVTVWSFVVSMTILGCYTLVSQLKGWSIYQELAPPGSLNVFVEYRRDGLRALASMGPLTLGYLCGIGGIAAVALRPTGIVGMLRLIFFILTMLVVMKFTDSRGGMLSGVAAMFVFCIFVTRSLAIRRTMLATGILAVAAIAAYLSFRGFDAIDSYGTFSYRAALLRTSMEQVWDQPLFGSPDFIEHPRFRYLIQGQGIIDIVNTYLQIVLRFGLVGLVPFALSFILSIWGLIQLRRSYDAAATSPQANADMLIISLMIAILVSYMVMIATTSDVAYMREYGLVFLALSQGLLRAPRLATGDARQPVTGLKNHIFATTALSPRFLRA